MPRGLGRKERSLLFVELWDSKLEEGRRVLCQRGRPLGVGHLQVDQRLHLGGDRQARRGIPMGWRFLQRAGRWLEVEWLQVRWSVYQLLSQDLVLDLLSFFAQKAVKISIFYFRDLWEFTNWDENQPSGNFEGHQQHCLSYNNYTGGAWNDATCGSPYKFLCSQKLCSGIQWNIS